MSKTKKSMATARQDERIKKAAAHEIDAPVHIPLLYKIIPPSVLAFITAIVYYPSLNYEFQFDDIANISRQFSIRFNTFKDLRFLNSRWISYWLNSIHYQISKFSPISYRVGNVAIHTINGLLLFFIVLHVCAHLTKNSFFKRNTLAIATMTSLLFLLHPVQTQTVSYVIQGQLEGLAALFIFSMILCVLKFSIAKNWLAKTALVGLLFGLAALSTGSKEIAIISPVLLILVDWFFIAHGTWDSIKWRLPLYAALSLIIIGFYIYFLKPQFFVELLQLKKVAANNIGNVITQDPKSKITPWIFCISQFKVILHYLAIFLWPFTMSVEYDWVLVKGFFALDCLFPFLVLVGIGGLIIYLLRKDRTSLVAFCLLWFFLAILPRSSLIPSSELMVDYKTYTASFGWLMLLSIGLVALAGWILRSFKKLAHVRQHHALIAGTLMLATGLGGLTMQRNTVWRSGLDFWANILQNAPGKARAYNNYGVELSQNLKQFKESIPYFLKAIEMDCNYPDPCNNLAVAYSCVGETDLAIQALQKGLAINPYYPEGYNNLASFFLRKKDYAQAEKALNLAIQMRPYYGKAWFNLGRLYLEQNKQEQAWECFKSACMKGDLDNEFGFSTFAKASAQLQKWDEALIGFKKALECAPGNAEFEFNLANCYYFLKQFDTALAMYDKLLAKNPGDLKLLFNIGETYFTDNKPAKALEYFSKLEPHRKEFPQLYLRIAGCHEKMNNPTKAQMVLLQMLNEQLPDDLRNTTRGLLAQLETRYNLKHTV